MDIRLLFISNISLYASKKSELNIENIKKLWVCFIQNKITNFEQTTFLTWILKEKSGEKDFKNPSKRFYFLADSILYDIFNKIFIDPYFVDISAMPMDIFKCFQALFEYINLQQKTLEFNHRNQMRVLKFQTILGKEYFWTVLGYNQNEQVSWFFC